MDTNNKSRDMYRPLCVVFADAFAYGCYNSLQGLNGYNLCKINPGIGYSSNLHYTLFDGKRPDDVGFLTDYNWSNNSSESIRWLQKKCDTIVTLNNLYRLCRRTFLKKFDNIPFSEASYFSNEGKYKFMQNGACYVFGRRVSKSYEKEYRKSFQLAHQYINNGDDGIIVVLEELDHCGHEVGCTGKEYVDYAVKIVGETNTLFTRFESIHPDGVCILISDHGMSDVKCSVDIVNGLERCFGLPGGKYQFYNDSVYLRLWSDSPTVLHDLKEYLDTIDILVYITDEQRKICGAVSAAYGNLIYRLREGFSFEPNCFGVALRGGPKGLHGYMEPTDMASGILVTKQIHQSYINAEDIFYSIHKLIQRNP